MTDGLSPSAVDAAIEYVAARWPNHPFTASQREAWGDVLVYMRPGELKPALATLASEWRPDADKVLAAAIAQRPRAIPPNDVNAPKREAPDHETFAKQVDQWKSETFGDEVPTRGDEWIAAFHDKCHIPTKYRKEA